MASQAPSTSTHAHTEHLFTPMDMQGAFVVTNWGGGRGMAWRGAEGEGRRRHLVGVGVGKEKKMNSLSRHL